MPNKHRFERNINKGKETEIKLRNETIKFTRDYITNADDNLITSDLDKLRG